MSGDGVAGALIGALGPDGLCAAMTVAAATGTAAGTCASTA